MPLVGRVRRAPKLSGMRLEDPLPALSASGQVEILGAKVANGTSLERKPRSWKSLPGDVLAQWHGSTHRGTLLLSLCQLDTAKQREN